ncbi:MAG: type II toxin-antitoxin system RelE/ParE family toxin [Desulfobaccales bacterium]
MIKSFGCRETERLFNREPTKRIPNNLLASALRKLLILDAAENLEDLRSPPGNRLEPLKRDRSGQYSIRINDQFRICFVWHDNNAYNVEIVDYH